MSSKNTNDYVKTSSINIIYIDITSSILMFTSVVDLIAIILRF